MRGIYIKESSFSMGRLGDKLNVILALIIMACETKSVSHIIQEEENQNKDLRLALSLLDLKKSKYLKLTSEHPDPITALDFAEKKFRLHKPHYTNTHLLAKSGGGVKKFLLEYIESNLNKRASVKLEIKDTPRIDLRDLNKAHHDGKINPTTIKSSIEDFRKAFGETTLNKNLAAIHIRRQDSFRTEIANGFDSNYYTKLIDHISKQNNELRIKIFSQKENSEDLKKINLPANATVSLANSNDSNKAALDFKEMCSAEFLFPAKSYFSIMASVINRNKIFHDKAKGGQPHIANDRSHEFSYGNTRQGFYNISDITIQ
jgi:hypothetical protein